MRAPLPGRLPRPNGPVGLQPEQHLPPASLLAEVHQLQDRRCARCPATDPSAQSRRGARGLCCRYHCCARNTYSVRRDPGSLPHPTTVPRNLSLLPRSSSRGSTFPKLTRSWPFAASGALSAARRCAQAPSAAIIPCNVLARSCLMACAPSRAALVVRDGRFCRSPDVREARYRSSHAPPPRHADPCRSERCGNSALDAWYTGAPREPVPGKLQPPHRRSVSPSSPTSAARFRWHSEAFTSPSWLPPAAPRGVGW